MESWEDKPFGAVLCEWMATASYEGGRWTDPALRPTGPLALSPAAHVLHYASSCFEGLKVHRHDDGSIHAFRLSRHIRRFDQSARLLCLPPPPPGLVREAVERVVDRVRDDVPPYPASLYVRPTLIGSAPGIGAAGRPAGEALFFVLVSPVGEYFKGGDRGLKLLVDGEHWRTAPGFGTAKAGANYAASLRRVVEAKRTMGVDQVLFAPGGALQETGAANVFLLAEDRVVTPALSPDFLHGVTRDSILALARHRGMQVEERSVRVEELVEWCERGEVALSGTAAILAGVVELRIGDRWIRVGDGAVGPVTVRLRAALRDIQRGAAADHFGWLEPIPRREVCAS